MCYKTNIAVSGLACIDLSLPQCSSGQFYESDQYGHRRLCVPHGNKCTADPAHSCMAFVALCSDDRDGHSESSSSVVTTTTKASSLESSSETVLADAPQFCLSLCEKTDTRSMNASCEELPAASCESQDFYETDLEGRRSLCIQNGGKCFKDPSAVCEKQYPLCARGRSEAESNGCYLYCDKINTRTSKG